MQKVIETTKRFLIHRKKISVSTFWDRVHRGCHNCTNCGSGRRDVHRSKFLDPTQYPADPRIL